jgi:branched-subunit amino acid ABC-type transport system permease component
MPPTTTTTKMIGPCVTAMEGCVTNCAPPTTPARPASAAPPPNTLVKTTLSQVAPILPYLFLVLILIFRPRGLLGTREG